MAPTTVQYESQNKQPYVEEEEVNEFEGMQKLADNMDKTEGKRVAMHTIGSRLEYFSFSGQLI
jgi:hypothetical protein